MTRLVAGALLVALGMAGGWFLRVAVEPAPTARTERGTQQEVAEPAEASPQRKATKSAAAGPQVAPTPTAPATPVPAPQTKPVANKKAAGAARFMRSMLPLLKAQAPAKGRARAEELQQLLELDDRRTKRLAEIFATHEVRKVEQGLLPMLEGKEPDAAMITLLDESNGLSRALEDELGTTLNGDELDRAKTHFRAQAEAARQAQVEHEFQRLGLSGLTPDQERQIRELLYDEANDDGTSASAGGTTFRLKGRDGANPSAAEKARLRREKLSRFLTPEQLAQFDKRQAELHAESQAAAGLLGGALGELLGGEKKKD